MIAHRKALSIEPDNNKVCNLGICLMKQGRLEEAKAMLQSVTPACNDNRWASDSHLKSYERAQEMLLELETSMGAQGTDQNTVPNFSAFAIPGCDTGSYDLQHSSLWQPQPALPRQPRRLARSNLEQQFSQYADNSMTGALLATAGFGPSKSNTQASGNGVHSGSLVGNQQGSRQQQQQQQCEPLSQGHSWLQAGNTDPWDEEDSDYSSPDENSESNVQGSQQDAGQQLYSKADFQQMQWHAESLRQRLESVSVLGMGSRSSCASVAPQSHAWDSCGEELAQVRTISPPLSEQPLSSEATPFNPVAVPREQQPPVPHQGSVHSNENAPPKPSAGENRAFDSQRVPLTFDLTNGPRNNNGVNNNVLEERRVVKQLGAANGWNNNNNNKSFKSTTASGNSTSDFPLSSALLLMSFIRILQGTHVDALHAKSSLEHKCCFTLPILSLFASEEGLIFARFGFLQVTEMVGTGVAIIMRTVLRLADPFQWNPMRTLSRSKPLLSCTRCNKTSRTCTQTPEVCLPCTMRRARGAEP